MQVKDSYRDSIATSTALSALYVTGMVTPFEVISVLNAEGIDFMLIGAHAIVDWMPEARATKDVDVLVATRHHKKATCALLAAFPQLEADDMPVVTRLRDVQTRKILIDVVKQNEPLFRVALKHVRPATVEGQPYRIPSLEMALAMKFAPMVSPNREDVKKLLDAHDFIVMVRANPDIDLIKLAELGDFVYPGGGKEIVEKVRQARAGEKLML